MITNKLIMYFKKNLGVYNLVYKYDKQTFFSIIIVSFILFLVINSANIYFRPKIINVIFTNIIVTFLNCLIVFFAFYKVIKLQKSLIYKIYNKGKQGNNLLYKERIKRLRRYINCKGIHINDLKFLIDILLKESERKSFNKLNFIGTGALLLIISPLWNTFIQELFKDNNTIKFAVLFTCIVFLVIWGLLIFINNIIKDYLNSDSKKIKNLAEYLYDIYVDDSKDKRHG